jgi:hypothetical protein
MAQMVDSQQQELSVEDIIGIAGMNTGAEVEPQRLVEMINAELQMPNTLFLREGNTSIYYSQGRTWRWLLPRSQR